MEMKFENRRILVTGAGRGIGRALCKFLAEKSQATVFALARSADQLESLKKECPGINMVQADLNDWDATRAAVEKILPIDGLVNNAAIAQLAPFLDIKPEEIDASFQVNVKAVINVSQVVAKSMKESGGNGPKTIVNISSQAAQAALMLHTVYCGTKGALDIISKVMAVELGPSKIRVNCVNPTVVLTDMSKVYWTDDKAKKNARIYSNGEIRRG